MRPYGGLIGIDNYSLDKYCKSYQMLWLHAIIHDFSGFVSEYSEKGPGYSYVLPCPVENGFLGHVTGLLFCHNVKTLIQFAEMLKSRPVVLDFEGFRHKKFDFIIKVLAVSTENYCDTVSFSPPTSFKILSLKVGSKYFHGLNRENGDYPYCYLQQFFDGIALRFLSAIFLCAGNRNNSSETSQEAQEGHCQFKYFNMSKK